MIGRIYFANIGKEVETIEIPAPRPLEPTIPVQVPPEPILAPRIPEPSPV